MYGITILLHRHSLCNSTKMQKSPIQKFSKSLMSLYIAVRNAQPPCNIVYFMMGNLKYFWLCWVIKPRDEEVTHRANNQQTRAKPGPALQTPLSLINSLSRRRFVKIYVRRRHALTVADGAFSHNIDYVTIFQEIALLVQKLRRILLNGWILPIGGASSGRVCACSLRSRLVCRTA